MKTELVKEFRRGPYVIRHERWRHEGQPKKQPSTFMKSAYSVQDGSYIGNTRTAHRLWKRFGIEKFYCGRGGGTTCIGYNSESKTWYGWSHRAISGFKKGQMKRRKHIPNEGRQYRISNPKRAAIAFAGEVS